MFEYTHYCIGRCFRSTRQNARRVDRSPSGDTLLQLVRSRKTQQASYDLVHTTVAQLGQTGDAGACRVHLLALGSVELTCAMIETHKRKRERERERESVCVCKVNKTETVYNM